MTQADVRRFALVLAVQARIEGMKADNTAREQRGESLAYPGKEFFDAEEELRNLAYIHDDQL